MAEETRAAIAHILARHLDTCIGTLSREQYSDGDLQKLAKKLKSSPRQFIKQFLPYDVRILGCRPNKDYGTKLKTHYEQTVFRTEVFDQTDTSNEVDGYNFIGMLAQGKFCTSTTKKKRSAKKTTLSLQQLHTEATTANYAYQIQDALVAFKTWFNGRFMDKGSAPDYCIELGDDPSDAGEWFVLETLLNQIHYHSLKMSEDDIFSRTWSYCSQVADKTADDLKMAYDGLKSELQNPLLTDCPLTCGDFLLLTTLLYEICADLEPTGRTKEVGTKTTNGTEIKIDQIDLEQYKFDFFRFLFFEKDKLSKSYDEAEWLVKTKEIYNMLGDSFTEDEKQKEFEKLKHRDPCFYTLERFAVFNAVKRYVKECSGEIDTEDAHKGDKIYLENDLNVEHSVISKDNKQDQFFLDYARTKKKTRLPVFTANVLLAYTDQGFNNGGYNLEHLFSSEVEGMGAPTEAEVIQRTLFACAELCVALHVRQTYRAYHPTLLNRLEILRTDLQTSSEYEELKGDSFEDFQASFKEVKIYCNTLLTFFTAKKPEGMTKQNDVHFNEMKDQIEEIKTKYNDTAPQTIWAQRQTTSGKKKVAAPSLDGDKRAVNAFHKKRGNSKYIASQTRKSTHAFKSLTYSGENSVFEHYGSIVYPVNHTVSSIVRNYKAESYRIAELFLKNAMGHRLDPDAISQAQLSCAFPTTPASYLSSNLNRSFIYSTFMDVFFDTSSLENEFAAQCTHWQDFDDGIHTAIEDQFELTPSSRSKYQELRSEFFQAFFFPVFREYNKTQNRPDSGELNLADKRNLLQDVLENVLYGPSGDNVWSLPPSKAYNDGDGHGSKFLVDLQESWVYNIIEYNVTTREITRKCHIDTRVVSFDTKEPVDMNKLDDSDINSVVRTKIWNLVFDDSSHKRMMTNITQVKTSSHLQCGYYVVYVSQNSKATPKGIPSIQFTDFLPWQMNHNYEYTLSTKVNEAELFGFRLHSKENSIVDISLDIADKRSSTTDNYKDLAMHYVAGDYVKATNLFATDSRSKKKPFSIVLTYSKSDPSIEFAIQNALEVHLDDFTIADDNIHVSWAPKGDHYPAAEKVWHDDVHNLQADTDCRWYMHLKEAPEATKKLGLHVYVFFEFAEDEHAQGGQFVTFGRPSTDKASTRLHVVNQALKTYLQTVDAARKSASGSKTSSKSRFWMSKDIEKLLLNWLSFKCYPIEAVTTQYSKKGDFKSFVDEILGTIPLEEAGGKITDECIRGWMGYIDKFASNTKKNKMLLDGVDNLHWEDLESTPYTLSMYGSTGDATERKTGQIEIRSADGTPVGKKNSYEMLDASSQYCFLEQKFVKHMYIKRQQSKQQRKDGLYPLDNLLTQHWKEEYYKALHKQIEKIYSELTQAPGNFEIEFTMNASGTKLNAGTFLNALENNFFEGAMQEDNSIYTTQDKEESVNFFILLANAMHGMAASFTEQTALDGTDIYRCGTKLSTEMLKPWIVPESFPHNKTAKEKIEKAYKIGVACGKTMSANLMWILKIVYDTESALLDKSFDNDKAELIDKDVQQYWTNLLEAQMNAHNADQVDDSTKLDDVNAYLQEGHFAKKPSEKKSTLTVTSSDDDGSDLDDAESQKGLSRDQGDESDDDESQEGLSQGENDESDDDESQEGLSQGENDDADEDDDDDALLKQVVEGGNGVEGDNEVEDGDASDEDNADEDDADGDAGNGAVTEPENKGDNGSANIQQLAQEVKDAMAAGVAASRIVGIERAAVDVAKGLSQNLQGVYDQDHSNAKAQKDAEHAKEALKKARLDLDAAEMDLLAATSKTQMAQAALDAATSSGA